MAEELEQIDVYIFDDTLAVSDPITLACGDTIDLPYSSCWVYFVDNNPFMNWTHPSRFIFVSDSTGTYSIAEKDLFPDNWNSNYILISAMPRPTSIDLPADTNTLIESLNPDPNKYAVMICQEDNERFWNNMSATYSTLINHYGYAKENIFVHYVDGYSIQEYGDDFDGGDPSDDIDYSAYKDTLFHTFQELGGITNNSIEIPTLNEKDQLFICFFAHGSMTWNPDYSYVFLPPDMNSKLYDTAFARYLESLTCSQIIVYINSCFSGGFVTELMDFSNYNAQCKNRSVHTASKNEPAHTEIWITGGKFDEMTFYWTAAVRGFYPDEDRPWLISEYSVGNFPFYKYDFNCYHEPDYNPDLNNDSLIQMEEAFIYANNWNSCSVTGFYCPHPSLPPPGQHGPDDPQDSINISFSDTLLTLAGLAGHVKQSKTIDNRSYSVADKLIIDPYTTISVESGASFYLINKESEIIVSENANLNCLGESTKFVGTSQDNKITVNGSFSPGSLNTYKCIGQFRLNNPNLQITFNRASFTDTTSLINYSDELSINNSNFNNCYMAYSYNGDVSINNTSFVNTGLYLKNPVDQQESFRAVIDGCDFMNSTFNTISAIEIRSFDEFFVEDNEITGFDAGTQKAIEVWYSGDGEAGNQLISGNTIYGNETGLLVYSSIASVEKNNFNDNSYGVKFEGTSNVSLLGDSTETQYIKDNTYYEVYASSESFPVYFHYNEIVDSDNGGNPTDPLVYHNDTDTLTKRDVRYNCWRSGFSPNDDLYPAGGYLCLPEYCSSKKSAPETGPDEIMYNNAVEDFEAGNYDSAKATYMSLVEQYNGSPFSRAALKDLFSLEYFATNDYDELKNYYRTNDSIQADTSLSKLGDIMANKCDMELENWQTAIEWYEDVILNPETYEDSIYAVIDLGYLYLQIDSSTLKSTNGNLQEYIPGSWEKFDEKSAYLLSLLPGDKKKHVENKNLPKGKVGVLFQNVPNPFNNSTLVEFHLLEESTVALEVYDYTGKKLKIFKLGLLEQGRHSETLNCGDLAPGVYFYSLVVNGRLAESKKMNIQ